jgi:hypothetical protein
VAHSKDAKTERIFEQVQVQQEEAILRPYLSQQFFMRETTQVEKRLAGLPDMLLEKMSIDFRGFQRNRGWMGPGQ